MRDKCWFSSPPCVTATCMMGFFQVRGPGNFNHNPHDSSWTFSQFSICCFFMVFTDSYFRPTSLVSSFSVWESSLGLGWVSFSSVWALAFPYLFPSFLSSAFALISSPSVRPRLHPLESVASFFSSQVKVFMCKKWGRYGLNA